MRSDAQHVPPEISAPHGKAGLRGVAAAHTAPRCFWPDQPGVAIALRAAMAWVGPVPDHVRDREITNVTHSGMKHDGGELHALRSSPISAGVIAANVIWKQM